MNIISTKNLNPRTFSPVFVAPLSGGKSPLNPTIPSRAAVKAATFLSFLLPLGVLCIASAAAAERVPFVTIDQGFRSGVRERKFLVIKTEAEWKTLWRTHVQPNVPAKELPRVDFDKEMVVAVLVGEKPNGGYGIGITGIEERRELNQLAVKLREPKPPPVVKTIQVLTLRHDTVKTR